LVEAHPSVSSFRENLGDSYREVAIQEQEAGHTQKALETLQKALDILEKLVHTEPENAAYHAALGRAWNALGFIHDETCDNVKAIPAFEKAVKEQENAIARSPDHNEYKVFLCMHLENLAEQYLDIGSGSDALLYCNLALETRRKLNVEHPKYRDYARALADVLSKIGIIQRHTGDSIAALKSFTEARMVLEKFLTTAPDDPEMQGRLGAAFTRDAWIQSDLNQTDDALQSLELAINELRPLSKWPSGAGEGREWLTEAIQERARIFRSLNKNDEADKVDAERLELWKGRPKELAALALTQAGRAALIGYGRLPGPDPDKAKAARNLDLAAANLKLAVEEGFADLPMLRADHDAAILFERTDIQPLLNGLKSRSPSSPSQSPK
jgi:tetratricopeptide (TPR) repeat protein